MEWREEEILVLVKVYPTASKKYKETVCTAGITKAGKLIRIYPVPYRDLPRTQQFKKFQWIKARVQPARELLGRPESHKIDSTSIELLKHIKTTSSSGWKERMKYIYPVISGSMEEIKEKNENSKVSLAIFKPKYVEDFEIIEDNEKWDSKKQGILNQNSLFNSDKKPLEKIPYTFRYRFTCDDGRCNGHNMIVLDWEAGESYRNFKDMYKNEELTLQKLKQKWLDFFFRERESYFVVGTDSHFNKFMILTVISPFRKELQTSLNF